MSLANAIPIRSNGEVVAYVDQTDIKAVEPYISIKVQPHNLCKRMWWWLVQFYTGRNPGKAEEETHVYTKILFKDGTWMKVRINFLDFIAEYC